MTLAPVDTITPTSIPPTPLIIAEPTHITLAGFTPTPKPFCPTYHISSPISGTIAEFGSQIHILGEAYYPHFEYYKLQFREYFGPDDNDDDDQWHDIGTQSDVAVNSPEGRGYLGSWRPDKGGYPHKPGEFVLRIIVGFNTGDAVQFKRLEGNCRPHIILRDP